jgi:hypothetical protein
VQNAFFAKKAWQKPAVGFSFLAAHGKIVPAMRNIEDPTAPKRERTERKKEEVKRKKVLESVFCFFLFPSSCCLSSHVSR